MISIFDPIIRPHAYELLTRELGLTMSELCVAAHREGWAECVSLPRFTLPEEYEDILETACIIHALQGTSLTKSQFNALASKFARKEEGQFFTKGFVNAFIRHHSDQLSRKPVKYISPTRRSEGMQNKTLDFISSFNDFFEKNIINQKKPCYF